MYQRLLKRIEKKGALCRHLLLRNQFDLVFAGFFESHTAGHRFWTYRPGVQAEESELTHAIRDVYQALDRQMGLLLAELPAEANVFIISCFGMEDYYPTTGLIEAFCRQLGYQAAPEPAPPSLKPLPLARRMIPETWRAAIGNYLPLRIQERLLADQFRNSTNWEKTTAFAIPSLYTSFLRVNLQGREPQGIVQPGADYEAVLERLEDDLKQLIDPQTGRAAVQRIVRTADWFDCGPPESLPDMFVEWQPARHYMQRVVHPKAELVQQKLGYHRDSYHSNNGFIAAMGPSIQKRGEMGDVSLLDLAPTFLSLMGEAIPERMTGRPIEAIARLSPTNSESVGAKLKTQA